MNGQNGPNLIRKDRDESLQEGPGFSSSRPLKKRKMVGHLFPPSVDQVLIVSRPAGANATADAIWNSLIFALALNLNSQYSFHPCHPLCRHRAASIWHYNHLFHSYRNHQCILVVSCRYTSSTIENNNYACTMKQTTVGDINYPREPMCDKTGSLHGLCSASRS